MTSSNKLGILFALALLFEVAGSILLAGPFGSSLSNFTWSNWLTGWIVVCGAMLLAPWLLRWLGGPKPWLLLTRETPYKLSHSLYLGLLVGIVIAAYKALPALIIRFNGVPFDNLLPEWALLSGQTAFLPSIILSLAGAFFTFGYIQGLMARVFGERSGMLAAVLLFALGSTWPFGDSAVDIEGVPVWLVLIVLYLPIGIALAYLGTRTRSVLPVLTAVLTASWLTGLARAVHGTFGWLITVLVMVVMLLVGIEVVIGEHRRAGRFIAGFFKDIIKRSEGRLIDAVIFIVATAGLLFAVRASDMFYTEWYIYLAIPTGLLIISYVLWVVYSIIGKKNSENNVGS